MTVTRDLIWLVGEIATGAHVVIAGWVTYHALLNKRAVGSAVAWIGIAWLSPFIGGLLYYGFGINRVKRRARRLGRDRARVFGDGSAPVPTEGGEPLPPLEFAIGRLTGRPAEPGNSVVMLRDGDEAYPAMLAAIDGATTSVGLCSYIFRADAAGEKFIAALERAQRRGVAVRVLLDGIGGGYFWSGTYVRLRRAGVPVARFLHSFLPRRMPFLNMRNHRKLLTIDGRVAFAGGLNIGVENLATAAPGHRVRDTHFRLEGPVIGQLAVAFADDWLFQTGERLVGDAWFPRLASAGPAAARVITSGPDEDLEQIEFAALHAISCAVHSVRVVTPYFLPPEALTTALGLAAMRGIAVDIIVPEHSNHTILDWARRVPLRDLVDVGCRVWLQPSPFDHSKLMVIDGTWSLIGSANWDTRSFRLNFELNVEVQDAEFARRLIAVTPGHRQLSLVELDDDPLALRLRNGAARLLQPYL